MHSRGEDQITIACRKSFPSPMALEPHMTKGRDLGDFQTPPKLVEAILGRLVSTGMCWSRVLEPTCGRGNFLKGLLALDSPPHELKGIELQPEYLSEARAITLNTPASVKVGLIEANLFDCDLAGLDWADRSGPLLVVGNPPWVTNAAFGVFESVHRPPRSNVKKNRGIDAITGSSNFDAAEAVWLKILTELSDQSPTIALLCKTAVARNVLEHARRLSLPVASTEVIRLDARLWFGAVVEACLLVLKLGKSSETQGDPLDRIPIYAGFDATKPEAMMGFARGRVVADLEAYEAFKHVDGYCPMVWRQGVKHDAASVMELSRTADGRWVNKENITVNIESDYVFPLLKGTDLSHENPIATKRAVIVTQRVIGDETNRLEFEAPRLWNYLQSHRDVFSRRKSSVYRDRSAFAMFGIGMYTFAWYKVGVSGMHRRPVFQAIGPVGGRPVMLDDTGYFLPCDSPEQASLIAALLNTPDARGLLASLTLPGAKRPVTKGLLQRVDLKKLLRQVDREALLDQVGQDVERLTGRPPCWPRHLEILLEPKENDLPGTTHMQEPPNPWLSPPSITTAAL